MQQKKGEMVEMELNHKVNRGKSALCLETEEILSKTFPSKGNRPYSMLRGKFFLRGHKNVGGQAG